MLLARWSEVWIFLLVVLVDMASGSGRRRLGSRQQRPVSERRRVSGSYSGGGWGCECTNWGGRSLVCGNLVVCLLKVLLKDPDLVLHSRDQAFHFEIRLLLEDLFYPSSCGNHVLPVCRHPNFCTSVASGCSNAPRNVSIA